MKRAHGALVATLALVAGSCAMPELARRSEVRGPRVLAIIAEPPEVYPGQPVLVRALTAGLSAPSAARFRWFVCARPEATTNFTASSTFGQSSPDEGCFGANAVNTVPLGSTPEVTFAVPEDLLERVEALRAVYGAALSEASLRRVAETAGLPFTISLELTDGDATVQALKRVVVTTRARANANPPAPTVYVAVEDTTRDAAAEGDASADAASDAAGAGSALGQSIPTGARRLRASATEPERCELDDDGGALEVEAGGYLELAPDGDEERWLETYDTLDSAGRVSTLREAAFYSWFSTEGRFSLERTRAPTRNTRWRAPAEPGPVTQWLVVRDGRGGASACRFELRVRARAR